MSKHDCFFEAIYEIINNIYLENIKLSPPQKKQMKKYITLLNKIHCHPKHKTIRKKLVVQSGGFIPILLPIVAGVVTDLISNVIR